MSTPEQISSSVDRPVLRERVEKLSECTCGGPDPALRSLLPKDYHTNWCNASDAKSRLIRDLLALLVERETPHQQEKKRMPDEIGWVIERHMASQLHYWTGRPDHMHGQWSTKHEDARRFARRTDAECMLTWHCSDNGRVVEHFWAAFPAPQEPT